ncbi:DMT family transporter [Ferrimonas gelatinilytica]|uniref:DMT family transporter n=1 Tax=Ferrimonas gelatinilytica TaxID=1255257 RepID=A0ABP9S1J9_9GAMM
MTKTNLIMTLLALFAFAGNSILCRMALDVEQIDAASFTLLRLASGAALLTLLPLSSPPRSAKPIGSWRSGFWLMLYAVGFSYAYRFVDAGAGALVLFAAVQLMMLSWAAAKGERLSMGGVIGLLAAAGGLLILLLPGVDAPQPAGVALMVTAGIAWALYSIRGQGSVAPIADTRGNFQRAFVWALPLIVPALLWGQVPPSGAALAVLSGALTSALGYVLWYRVLPTLSTVAASVCQLSVPVWAALAGVFLLGESFTLRLVLSSGLVLGGISLVLWQKQHRA